MGIRVSDVLSEADLLAEFYHRCKLVGIKVRLEVFLPSTLHRSKRMRADVAVFRGSGDEIVACVEGKTPGAKVGGNTRQKHAYEALRTYHGVHVFWINGFEQLDDLVGKVGELARG